MIKKPKRVPWRFYSLASSLFNEMKISPVDNKDEIEVPTIHEFTARVADEFLKIYGPRRFLSFVQRCQLSGPWSKTIKIKEKIGPVTKTVSYSKYEFELSALVKKKKNMELLKKGLSEVDNNRLEYLQELVSDSISKKTDNELYEISFEFIKKLKAPA